LLAAARNLPVRELIGVEVSERVHGAARLSDAPLLEGVQLDRRIVVTAAAALEMRERLARDEGLLVGAVTGANLAGAIEAARALGAPSRVLSVSVDSGERA
jgi:cysteine synthase